MAKTKIPRKYPARASEVPATQAMLYHVRDELKAEIRSATSSFKSQDQGLLSVKSEIKSLSSEIKSLEYKMDSRFEKMSSEMHQLHLLIEEQNAKNNIVLDGLTGLFHRQDRVENRMTEINDLLSMK